MSERSTNGKVNPARPFSVFAMIVICLSLMVFFIQFADAYSKERIWKITIKTNGVISMAFAMLIFTRYHDLMTIVSSFFGLFVLVGIIRTIYKSELTSYKITGVLCVLLLGMNNYIYYTQDFIEYLPLLQKITLVIVLIWVIGLNYEMNNSRILQDYRNK